MFDVTKALDLSIESERDKNGTAQISLMYASDVLSLLEALARSASANE
jgi:hypothetical protein